LKNEILKYANGFNAKNNVLEWLENNVTEDSPQGEVEHIIDYMVNNDKDYSNKSYNRMVKDSNKWMDAQIQKGKGKKEIEGKDIETIKKWKDGFRFVKLISKKSYELEGFRMHHCLSSYYGKNDEIYSLRDKNNKPHATLSRNSLQIKGYGNGSIHPKYVKYNVEFLKELGLEVRDSEMENLGYYNLEKFKKYLHKDTIKELFDKKYWFKGNKLLDKNGEIFACFELWDKIPLIQHNPKNQVKINFDLSSFNNNAINFIFNKFKLFKTKNSSGDYARIGSSGDSARIGSSGYSAQIGSSGDYF
jgi:hypothetical protein